jgi:hypothetical protein
MAGDEASKGVCFSENVDGAPIRVGVPSHNVVNRKFQPLSERRTDTMKTYILRDPNSVEPQRLVLGRSGNKSRKRIHPKNNFRGPTHGAANDLKTTDL